MTLQLCLRFPHWGNCTALTVESRKLKRLHLSILQIPIPRLYLPGSLAGGNLQDLYNKLRELSEYHNPRMNIASIIGSIGIVIGLIRAVPQLIKLLNAREAYGVSADTAATSSIVSCGWTTYGILTGQPYLSLASGSTAVIFAVITFFALRFGRSAREFKVAPIWLIVLILAGTFFGKSGLGILLPISMLAANIPQIWVAYKEGNLADLSLGTWALSITEGLVWVTYSFIQQDISIRVSASFQLITSGMIVALKLRHKNK
jgi:uncharacterized protein with PQ loop repeat